MERGFGPRATKTRRSRSTYATRSSTSSGKGEDKAISSPLKVLAGEFKNHQGMVKDLLADVGRSSKPYLLYELQRFLNSNTNNLFNQLNDANVAKMNTALACGRVAKASGEILIGKV